MARRLLLHGYYNHTMQETSMKRLILAVAAAAAVTTSLFAVAHGNVTPQGVDTTGLPVLGDKWRDENPYKDNKLALKIGSSAYNQNCARCHGLEAVSGGIAPDLRMLGPRLRRHAQRDQEAGVLQRDRPLLPDLDPRRKGA
jgi:cytochrome c-550 PedF